MKLLTLRLVSILSRLQGVWFDNIVYIYMRRVRIIALFDYIIKIRDFIWAPFEYKVTGGEAVVAPPPKEDLDGIVLFLSGRCLY